VRSGASPILLFEALEQLGRGGPNSAEHGQRGLDRPVVVQPACALRLVVALDDRVVLGEELPHPQYEFDSESAR